MQRKNHLLHDSHPDQEGTKGALTGNIFFSSSGKNPNTVFYVKAGVVNRLDTVNGQLVRVSQMISNQELPYNNDNVNNDYIILKLEEGLIFNADVQPACLPSADYFPDSSQKVCSVSGWGRTNPDISIPRPDNLQYIDLPLVNFALCQQR